GKKQKMCQIGKWWENRKECAIVYMTCGYNQNMPKNIDRDFKKRIRSIYVHFPFVERIQEKVSLV
ncbi:hypothetical protein DBR06_SOUSAS9310040, partial [Sousa chinensis]